MFLYCKIFNKLAAWFQCVFADDTGHILTTVKGLKNMQIIKNLQHLVGKTKVEISNIGLWSDYNRVTEKSHLIFSDEVNVEKKLIKNNHKQMRIYNIFKQIILCI